MKTLSRVLKWIDIFTEWHSYILSVPVVALIVMIVFDITARQFGLFTTFLFDMQWFIFAGLLTLSMGYAALKGTHVRIDWIVTKFPPRTQEVIIAISWALIVLPSLGFLGRYAWDFFITALQDKETTVTVWHVIVWPVKMFIFAGVILMVPPTIAALIRSVHRIIKGQELI